MARRTLIEKRESWLRRLDTTVNSLACTCLIPLLGVGSLSVEDLCCTSSVRLSTRFIPSLAIMAACKLKPQIKLTQRPKEQKLWKERSKGEDFSAKLLISMHDLGSCKTAKTWRVRSNQRNAPLTREKGRTLLFAQAVNRTQNLVPTEG